MLAVIPLIGLLIVIAGCVSATPQYAQTRDGWAFEMKTTSDHVDYRIGNSQGTQPISPGFQWFDSAQACQNNRASKAAQLSKAMPYIVKSPQQDEVIKLSECRQAAVTVNEGGMWGYMKPDGSGVNGMTAAGACEPALAADVIQRVMPIGQRNCIPVSITWK